MVQLKEPTSRFIRVQCSECKNQQVIFGKATSKIDCLVCSKPIALPTGGKILVKARILEVLE